MVLYIQHDILVSFIRSDLGVNFQIDLSVQKCICFDASQSWEYDGVTHFFYAFYRSNLFRERLILLKSNIFDLSGKIKM